MGKIDREKLEKCIQDGMSGSDIARLLGCSREAVRQATLKWELSSRVCMNCGKQIPARGVNMGYIPLMRLNKVAEKRYSRKWCSAECERIAHNARHNQYYYNRKEQEGVA